MTIAPSEVEATVSVIVTTRNSESSLHTCLRSLTRQTYPAIELLVIDNQSTDGTVDIARRYADVVETAGPERSAQRNHGARLATGKYLFFIDSDMELHADVVAQCVGIAEHQAAAAVIIPETSIGKGFWSRCRILERTCYDGDDQVEAARFYERTSYFEAGGFDETLLGAEDWDLSNRVLGDSMKSRTGARITHDEGRITIGEAFRKRRYYAGGYFRYLLRRRGAAASQGNVLARSAYIRNWRRLAGHPLLTSGMICLKFVEAAGVAAGGIDQLRALARPQRSIG